MRSAVALLLVAAWLLACETDVQHDLGEREANEILVLLSERGIAADKVAETASGRWTVRVPSPDATRAWQLLQAAGLPRRSVEGFAETFGEPGLIPSPIEEHARLLRATAGELERSIMAMPGVLDAHVHLVEPEPARWGGPAADGELAQAAVLVVYHPGEEGGATLDVGAVRRLVAGAVAGLAPERIEVVATPRELTAVPAGESLARLGPFTVGRASQGPLRLVLGVGGALVLALSVALVLLLVRLRRARSVA